MAAASRLFAEQGYDATTVETIASAAGIAAPSIYKHFPTKHAILLAVTDRATRTSQARRGLGLTDDLPHQLAALFAEYLAVGQIQRRRLSIELSRAATRNDQVAGQLAAYNAELRQALADTIGHSDPTLGSAECDLLAHLFLVLLMGAIHLDTLDAERIGDQGLIEFLRARFAVVLASNPPLAPERRPARPGRAAAAEELDPTDGRRARTVRTRRRILDAAGELFARHGYDGTSTEMIASGAGITVPGMYRHVNSKEELLLEVARRSFDGYRLVLPVTGDGDTSPDGFARALGAFARSRDSTARRLAIELDFGAWRSDQLADALKEFHLEVRSSVAESLLTAGYVTDTDEADRAAMVVLMLFMGTAHIDTVDPTLVDNRTWRDCLRRTAAATHQPNPGGRMLTIASMLERQAARHGRTIAMIDDPTGEEWTVADLDGASASAAAALLAAGVGPGDRVALLSANHPSMVITYLAVARIGAVLVPLNWRLTTPELCAIASDAGITALVANADLTAAASVADAIGITEGRRWSIGDTAAMSPIPPLPVDRGGAAVSMATPAGDDLLYLMYTSGTTGRPKGAMHTHATTLAAAIGAIEAMDYRPGDRYLNVMPLFHVASLAMVNICLRRRCTMVLGRAFDPAAAWQSVARYRIDAMMAVPAMLQAMATTRDPALDTSSLRVLSSGAAPVPLPLLEQYRDLGIDIIQAYGLTEVGGAVSVLDAADATGHLGSAGNALLTLDMQLVDAAGEPVDPGVAGEILVRGDAVTTGYWQMPEATAETFIDGWFRTGDIGVLDRDGFLTIRDRVKDMLISGGENVYPAEIESVLLRHPKVADVAVIGVPSAALGRGALRRRRLE